MATAHPFASFANSLRIGATIGYLGATAIVVAEVQAQHKLDPSRSPPGSALHGRPGALGSAPIHENPNGLIELMRKWLTAALWVIVPLSAVSLIWRMKRRHDKLPTTNTMVRSEPASGETTTADDRRAPENPEANSDEFGLPPGTKSTAEESSARYVVGRVGNLTQRTGQPTRPIFSLLPQPPQRTPNIWSFVVTEVYRGRSIGHAVEMRGQDMVGNVNDGKMVKFERNRIRGRDEIVKLTRLYDVRSGVEIYVRS